MKKLMLSTAVLVATTFGAQAQDQFRTAADPLQIPASELVGKRVYASEAALDADEYAGAQEGWEDIGEINDIMLNRDGSVDSVLVDIGGFLGMGERQVAVGMDSLRFISDSATPEDLGDYFLVLNADRTVIEGAPNYERMPGAMPADTMSAETKMPADTTATGTMPSTDEAYVPIEASSLTMETLVGAPVYGPNDESIGEVSEVQMAADQKIEMLIVDVGGFLGMGEKPVALSVNDIVLLKKADGDDLRVQVSMTEEQLKNLPAVK